MNKSVKFLIIACVILVAGFAVFSYFNARQEENKGLTLEKDRGLTEAEAQTYNQRLTDSEKMIAEAKNDDEKYSGYMNKGFQLYGLGKLNDAKEAFIAAQKIKAGVNPLAALYEVYVEMNNYNEAKVAIQQAIDIHPANADLWKKYIILEKEKLNASNDTVSSLYAEAVVKTSNSIDILTTYAAYLSSIGNHQSSKEYWQKAIEANPSLKPTYEVEIKNVEQKMKESQT
jgi:tetratricopeptide (TPR) repeat protein